MWQLIVGAVIAAITFAGAHEYSSFVEIRHTMQKERQKIYDEVIAIRQGPLPFSNKAELGVMAIDIRGLDNSFPGVDPLTCNKAENYRCAVAITRNFMDCEEQSLQKGPSFYETMPGAKCKSLIKGASVDPKEAYRSGISAMDGLRKGLDAVAGTGFSDWIGCEFRWSDQNCWPTGKHTQQN